MNSSEVAAEARRETPSPLALVVCDKCWRDPYTGKLTIIGTFSAVSGPVFPLRHPILTVYAAMTNGLGSIDVKVRLVDCDEEREPLFLEQATLQFADPRMVVEMVFEVQMLEFPVPGEHRLQLFANGDFLMERRIFVVDQSAQPD